MGNSINNQKSGKIYYVRVKVVSYPSMYYDLVRDEEGKFRLININSDFVDLFKFDHEFHESELGDLPFSQDTLVFIEKKE